MHQAGCGGACRHVPHPSPRLVHGAGVEQVGQPLGRLLRPRVDLLGHGLVAPVPPMLRTDGNAVDTATGKSQGQGAVSTSNSLTKANTVKASPLDQVSGLEIFMSDRSKASEQTPDSPGNAAVVQNGQEFAMRMQAMIEAWEGTSGTARNAALDRKL